MLWVGRAKENNKVEHVGSFMEFIMEWLELVNGSTTMKKEQQLNGIVQVNNLNVQKT